MSANAHGAQTSEPIDSILARQPRAVSCYIAGSLKLLQPPLGLQIAVAHSAIEVIYWCFDLFEHQRWISAAAQRSNVVVLCQADWPARPTDIAILQLARDGSAELACELFQSAWESLTIGGELWVWVNNLRDQWTRRQLQSYAPKVQADFGTAGVWYHLRKIGPAARHRQFTAEFAFRDQGQLLFVHTRPGVFSHRRLDNGARQLIRALPQNHAGRIMDLGCGSGAVALAAARRNPAAEIVAIDSNCRALEVVSRSAERNGVTNIRLELNCDGEFACDGGFDWVFTNPPYFAQHRIAAQFIDSARRVLNSSGTLIVVTKTPREIAELMEKEFAEVRVDLGPNYALVQGLGIRCAAT